MLPDASAHAAWSLAIDTGSTYVDALLHGPGGREHGLKHPRQAQAPAAAAVTAVQRLLAEARVAGCQVGRVVHGTTIVTNALVTQTVAPAAWLTNRGFGDLLRLGRQQRAELYAAVPLPRVPVTLFPPDLCFELGGRIDASGHEVAPLDGDSLDQAIDQIATAGVRAVGVGLLFSHLNPGHEEAVARRLQERLPGVAVALSHRVDGQAGEVERFLATALDAAMQPVAGDYLAELREGLGALGLPAVSVIGSDTVLLSLAQARGHPLRIALSGPAAALLAAARADPGPVLISMDVGGTTTDIGLVVAGVPRLADTLAVGAYHWRQRAADIASLAIGGGSRVRLLPGAALRVGPESAGADPGPAAYGRGGQAPTLSDALLLLGRLPQRLAGGLVLQRPLAEAALAPIADTLGTTSTGLAQAVVAAAAADIAEGVKHHAFARGIEPREAVLLAAGGGGAQHAAEVATLLGMKRVRVPSGAGLLAARGLLMADPGKSTTASTAATTTAASPSPMRSPPPDGDWAGIADRGIGPAALFGTTQTAWVPSGWAWCVEPGGDLLLEHHGD